MAYVYLLNLHDHIDRRLNEAGNALVRVDGDLKQVRFQEGRIDVLTRFREFLKEDLDPKLPKAIRKRMKESS